MLFRTMVRHFHLLLLLYIFFSSSLITIAHAVIRLHNASGAELATFQNTDFVDSKTSIDVIEGDLIIANFLTVNGCFIKRQLFNVSVLIVPFDVAKQNGCNTYADVISR